MNKKKGIIIGVLAIALVMVAGYALFSDTLTINGTATAEGAFDMQIISAEVTSEVGSSGATTQVSADKNTLTINVPKLEYPGAYVEVAYKIKNAGTITGMYNGAEVTGETDKIKLDYEITNTLYEANDEHEETLKIYWDENNNSESKESTTITLKINFVQYDGSSVVLPPVTEPDKVYSVGEEFCIGTECFYVIHDDGDSVAALSKYNLNTDENRQSESSPTKIEFTDISYWGDGTYDLKPEYGSSYPADVYDSNSKLYPYAENYESYLKGLGKSSVSARLLTYDELVSLGCEDAYVSVYDDSNIKLMAFVEEPTIHYSCSNAPVWVGSTYYWLATAGTSSKVYRVLGNDYDLMSAYDGTNIYNVGLRPVIEISKSEI